MKIPPQTLKMLPPPLIGTLHLPIMADAANMRSFKPGKPVTYAYAGKTVQRHAVAPERPGSETHPRYVALRKNAGDNVR